MKVNLELKKIELSKKRVQLGIDELAFKIIEREEDTKRIKENILISQKTIADLDKKISDIQGV